MFLVMVEASSQPTDYMFSCALEFLTEHVVLASQVNFQTVEIYIWITQGTFKESLLVLCCSSSLWFWPFHFLPRPLSISFFVLYHHSVLKCMCCAAAWKIGKLCLKQAGGRHVHCCWQHMHIDSCFVSVGRKTVVVFQCSGRYALMLL